MNEQGEHDVKEGKWAIKTGLALVSRGIRRVNR